MTKLPLVQVRGGAPGEVWNPPPGAVPRLPDSASEADQQQALGSTADDRQRGRRPSARQALRRTGSLPQVHETRVQQFQGRGEHRRVEIPPRPRPVARTRDLAVHGRGRNEEEEDEEAQGGAEPVFTAERGDGVLGAHLHGRVHRRWAIRHGAREEQRPMQPVRHVSGCPDVDSSLRHVPEEGQRRVLTMPADVAAPEAPLVNLRTIRLLQSPSLQAIQVENGAREEEGRFEVEATCEEGRICQNHLVVVSL